MWWRRADRELARELRFHIESQVQENLRAGMQPAEARRQAALIARKPVESEIVGIVRDVKHMGVKNRAWPAMYLPALQLEGLEGATMLVRSGERRADLLALVTADLRAADPSARIEYSGPLETEVDAMISRERLIAYLSTAFGALAALLAAVGLYGVMAYNM